MSRKVKLAALSLGTVLLLGALGLGVAAAADPEPTQTSYHEVFVGKVAKILGVDQEKVDAAFTQARTEMIDEAVKEGRIIQERADFMKQHLEQGALGSNGRGGLMGGPMRGGRGHGPGWGGQFGSPPQSAPAQAPAQ